MSKFLRKFFLKFRPFSAGDRLYGYTCDLIDEEAVKHLKRIVSIQIVESSKTNLKVKYQYSGKGGHYVSNVKVVPRNLLNNYYFINKIHFC